MPPNETSTTITFRHAFKLPGMDGHCRAGTYALRTERVPLDVSWEAYRTTTTIMITDGGSVSAWLETNEELTAALARDKAHDEKDGHS